MQADKPNLTRLQNILAEDLNVAVTAEEVGQLYKYKDNEYEY